jgi:hypothetical protein
MGAVFMYEMIEFRVVGHLGWWVGWARLLLWDLSAAFPMTQIGAFSVAMSRGQLYTSADS